MPLDSLLQVGARGPHDDFESAAKVLRAAFARFALDQDVDGALEYIADDVEYVSRDGTFYGPGKWADEVRVQTRAWRLELEVEEIIDAGGGALVLYNKMLRIDKETGEVGWKAWPATVVRVLDGKIAFFEGYIDRRKALADLGVEQG